MSQPTTNPNAAQRYMEMRTAMLLHTPFFASLMLDMLTIKVGKFPGVPTAGTDGRTMWFDEDFLASLSLPEAVFLCCHEISHCMWMHMDRGRHYADVGFEGAPFQMNVYNVAADYVINSMLVKSNVGIMPKCGLLDPQYSGQMLVEDVYRELLKKQPPKPKSGQGVGSGPPGSGQGQGDGQGSPDGGAGVASKEGTAEDGDPIDTHVYAPAKVAEAEMKRAIVSAVNQAKAMGKMPSELERWVTDLITPKVKWKERLCHLISHCASRETTTWAAPHRRRLVTQHVYLPSYTGFSAGEIVKAVDTSGSMGQREFDVAYSETANILTTCRPRKLWLMSCDAKVHDVHELDADEDIYERKPKLRGGGGTSFCPVFEEIAERGIRPDCLIYFTDGYGTFPDEPPPYPVIWVMTTDVVPPFGDVVKVEIDTYEQ